LVVEFVANYQKESKMRTLPPVIKILFFLFAIQAFSPAVAQETMYEVFDVMDLPPGLNPKQKDSCSLEFQEQWIFNVASASISKKVNAFGISCKDSTEALSLPEGTVRLKNLSYEFSFMDLMDQMDQKARQLQETMITLINHRYQFPEVYNPRKQLLSVYFHEDWVIEADQQHVKKKVKGITPVIWQQRQTAEGEPIHDAATGYPVFYKLKLERIELRQP